MMTFVQTKARDVRPGALLMSEGSSKADGLVRHVHAVRAVEEGFGTVNVTFTDAAPQWYGRDDTLWVAQR